MLLLIHLEIFTCVCDQANVTPELLSHKGFPAGVYLLEMEYLPSEDGWMCLHRAAPHISDWGQATTKLEAALSVLHSCHKGEAVHGDLRGPNIMVR